MDAATAGLQILHATLEDETNIKVASTPKKTILGPRHIGDARSWIIPLNTSGTTVTSPHLDYVIGYAVFQVSNNRDYDSSYFNHYSIVTNIVCELSLQHQYFLNHDITKIQHHFRDRTIAELYKLSAAQQPLQLPQLFPQGFPGYGVKPNMAVLANFQPTTLSSWTYYDDEMLEVLKADLSTVKSIKSQLPA